MPHVSPWGVLRAAALMRRAAGAGEKGDKEAVAKPEPTHAAVEPTEEKIAPPAPALDDATLSESLSAEEVVASTMPTWAFLLFLVCSFSGMIKMHAGVGVVV